MDAERAEAMLRRVSHEQATAESLGYARADRHLLKCARCNGDLRFDVLSAAPPSDPQRLPPWFYHCSKCRTYASARVVNLELQELVRHRWNDPEWLAGHCSALIDRLDREIASAHAVYEFCSDHRTRRQLKRRHFLAKHLSILSRYAVGLAERRAALASTAGFTPRLDARSLTALQSTMHQLQALEAISRWRKRSARAQLQDEVWAFLGVPELTTRTPIALWETKELAKDWTTPAHAQVPVRWALVAAAAGDSRVVLRGGSESTIGLHCPLTGLDH